MGEPCPVMTVDPNDNTTSMEDVVVRPKNDFFLPGSRTWTDVLPKTEHVDVFRNCDYSCTTLGHIADWGPALRLYIAMVFTDSRAACVYWGPDRVATYNAQFVPHSGGLHPGLMGKPFKLGFPELYDQIDKMFDQAAATVRTVDVENILLFVDRHGYSEEAYFTGQFIPLRGDSGEIEGFYNTVYESTAQVLHDRRRRIVESIASIPPLPVNETLSMIVEALRDNPNDITMAMLYSYDELSTTKGANLRLCGSLGIPEGHRCAPAEADLATGYTGMVPYFRRVHITGKPLVLSESDGSIQATHGLFDGISWCGYGEPSRDIVVLPLTIGATILGFYVQGTNPRRAYDEATQMSIIDMGRQVEAKWASSLSSEQAMLRERILEDRASDSENRLRHMAQSAPLGMFQVNPDYEIQWANEQFYEMTGHDRMKPNVRDFLNVFIPEERETVLKQLDGLLKGSPRVVKEYQLQRAWQVPAEEGEDAETSPTWILASSFPLMENGQVKLIMGYVTDISHQKWAESVQSRNAVAATQAKRRQEEFIDTTSHEMRNPLTAITQLADGIHLSLTDAEDSKEAYRAIAQANVDAANTILLCAAHQKRVIDDVLTLSRLESEMLSITPVIEQPTKVVSDTIKMFDGESSMQNVPIRPIQHQSYRDLNVDYVLIDTSRLMQVLINLLSNAIKFTAPRPVREISVLYGAQAHRPPAIKTTWGDLGWIAPQNMQRGNKALPPATTERDRLYLYFCVQDTGPGMTSKDMEKLFKRFSQVTPRTHITYGGSGLGLYICQQLAEKQGGAVGVASRSGEGSAFGFYIETRVAMTSDNFSDHDHAPAPQQIDRNRPNPLRRPSESVHMDRASEETLQASHTRNGWKQQQFLLQQLKKPRLQDQLGDLHVLLVEDNIVNQRVLAKQLRMAKCTVTVANHGAEALGILEKADCWRKPLLASEEQRLETSEPPLRIDVILMDWEMPVMNGLTCCQRIRELEAEGQITRRLFIVAITANVRQEQQERAIAAGMDMVVSKPFTVRDLLDSVRETLGIIAERPSSST